MAKGRGDVAAGWRSGVASTPDLRCKAEGELEGAATGTARSLTGRHTTTPRTINVATGEAKSDDWRN